MTFTILLTKLRESRHSRQIEDWKPGHHPETIRHVLHVQYEYKRSFLESLMLQPLLYSANVVVQNDW